MEYFNHIYNADCMTGMNVYPDRSIDLILCDLPYGVTDCGWDKRLDLELLWREYKRIIKDNGAILLTAAQPFTTELISSNFRMFRYCWYWKKNMATGFTFSKFQPLRCIEDICVFYKKAPVYNPQGVIYHDKPIISRGKRDKPDTIYHTDTLGKNTEQYVSNYPKNLLSFKCERGLHPTQKPVALFEYLIKTYTNKGDIVLDNCMGSGTTAIACIRTGRVFTGFEANRDYYIKAQERIIQETNKRV